MPRKKIWVSAQFPRATNCKGSQKGKGGRWSLFPPRTTVADSGPGEILESPLEETASSLCNNTDQLRGRVNKKKLVSLQSMLLNEHVVSLGTEGLGLI